MWKDIMGYEGLYKIHEDGTIVAYAREWNCGHGNGSLRRDGEKVISPHKNHDGYLMVNLRKDGKVKMVSVHRLIACNFIPNPTNLPQVNHIDGVKTNNSITNLEWCSSRDNLIHAIKTGLFVHKRGQENKCRTITDDKAREVLNAYLAEPNATEIGRRFNLSRYLVMSIVHRSGSYKEIGGPLPSEENRREYMRSRVIKGENNPTAKFSDAKCEEIRKKKSDTGLGYKKLAEIYGCSPAYISQIVKYTGRFRKVRDS